MILLTDDLRARLQANGLQCGAAQEIGSIMEGIRLLAKATAFHQGGR